MKLFLVVIWNVTTANHTFPSRSCRSYPECHELNDFSWSVQLLRGAQFLKIPFADPAPSRPVQALSSVARLASRLQARLPPIPDRPHPLRLLRRQRGRTVGQNRLLAVFGQLRSRTHLSSQEKAPSSFRPVFSSKLGLAECPMSSEHFAPSLQARFGSPGDLFTALPRKN